MMDMVRLTDTLWANPTTIVAFMWVNPTMAYNGSLSQCEDHTTIARVYYRDGDFVNLSCADAIRVAAELGVVRPPWVLELQTLLAERE